MDTFLEQLVSIKKDAKIYFAYIGIAIAAILVMMVSLMILGNLAIIVIFLVLYGAYKLYSMLSIEYEYIITNYVMDIDKITSKSSRKRVSSFDLTAVERIEKYRSDLPQDLFCRRLPDQLQRHYRKRRAVQCGRRRQPRGSHAVWPLQGHCGGRIQ